MLPGETFNKVKHSLEAAGKPDQAVTMAAYMKNHFPFYGVKAPQRKALVKSLRPSHDGWTLEEWIHFANLCFSPGEARELQYVLGDWWIPTRVKKLTADWLPLVESLVQTLSWWDTVDWLATHFAGNILRNTSELQLATTKRWIEHDSIWLQRTAILFQLSYKQDTNAELLFNLILRRANSKEFFIQKAAGWALRQYSKVNPSAVHNFIITHKLAPLTVREGSKYLVVE